MSTESDRLIAERMGWTECETRPSRWHRPMVVRHCWQLPILCEWASTVGPLDLADARDREAVIAWLNAQRMAVMTTECAAAYIVSIHETEPDGTPKIEAVCMARGTAGQKVEAFRAAVLAATEGKEQ